MALSDYEFCKKDAKVEVIKNGESFSALIDGKIVCSMSSGGCHRFHTELEAEVFAKHVVRGYNGGCFLSEDVDNYVFDKNDTSWLK